MLNSKPFWDKLQTKLNNFLSIFVHCVFFSILQAAKIACDKLKERMAPVAKQMEGAKWNQIVQACFFNGIDLCSRHM